MCGVLGTVLTTYGYILAEVINTANDKPLYTQQIVNAVTQTSEHIYNALFM